MLRRFFAITLCATFTACVGQSAAPVRPNTPTPSLDQQIMLAPDKQIMSAPGKQSVPKEPTPETPINQTEPQPVPIDAATLVGMADDRITALFGMPVFVRRDPPVEFWRYRAKTCVLLMFFYRQNGERRVSHIEMRGSGGVTVDQPNCIRKLQK